MRKGYRKENENERNKERGADLYGGGTKEKNRRNLPRLKGRYSGKKKRGAGRRNKQVIKKSPGRRSR